MSILEKFCYNVINGLYVEVYGIWVHFKSTHSHPSQTCHYTTVYMREMNIVDNMIKVMLLNTFGLFQSQARREYKCIF